MQISNLKKFTHDSEAILEELAPQDVLLLLDAKNVPCFVVTRVPAALPGRNSFIADIIHVAVAEKYIAPETMSPATTNPIIAAPKGGAIPEITEGERALFKVQSQWDFYLKVVRPILTHGNDLAVRVYSTDVPDFRMTLNRHGGLYARCFVRKGYIRLQLTVEEHNVAATGQTSSNSAPDQIIVNIPTDEPLPAGLAAWVETAYQEALKR